MKSSEPTDGRGVEEVGRGTEGVEGGLGVWEKRSGEKRQEGWRGWRGDRLGGEVQGRSGVRGRYA